MELHKFTTQLAAYAYYPI